MSALLPQVAVTYDIGAAGPLEIIRAAEGLAGITFLYDRCSPDAEMAAEFFEEFDVGLDITGHSIDQVVAELTELGIGAILTFSEFQLRRTADIAAPLGARFHAPDTIDVLISKPLQRCRLSEHGVDTVRYAIASTAEDLVQAIDKVGLPAVVKPAIGTSSRHTYLIENMEDANHVLSAWDAVGEIIVEEYLVGDTRRAGRLWGDYVSVESVSFDGEHQTFAVVGKLPLAPPFRETGMFWPSTLDADIRDHVERLASRALDALGVRHGVTQTEIKLTAAGPRIIEVNGRLGGYVADIVRRGGGDDPVRHALHSALGTKGYRTRPSPEDRVAYQIFLPAPAVRAELLSIEGLREVKALAGVDRATCVAEVGETVDWRQGTRSYVAIVAGQVAGHAQLASLRADIDMLLRLNYRAIGAPAGHHDEV